MSNDSDEPSVEGPIDMAILRDLNRRIPDLDTSEMRDLRVNFAHALSTICEALAKLNSTEGLSSEEIKRRARVLFEIRKVLGRFFQLPQAKSLREIRSAEASRLSVFN